MSNSAPTMESLLQSAKDLLAAWTSDVTMPEPNRVDARVATTDLLAAVSALRSARWGNLAAITGLDPGVSANVLEVLYHFCAGAAVLSLRVSVPRSAASVPSLCALAPAASFFERELSEMFGITVENAPNTDRLLLPEDWPEGVYPLRKDFVVTED